MPTSETDAIEMLPIVGARAVATLVELLETNDTRIQSSALRALARIGPGASAATNAISAFIEDEHLWSEAIRALAAIGPSAQPATPALLKALADHPEAAIDALGHIHSHASAVVPAIERVLAMTTRPALIAKCCAALSRYGPLAESSWRTVISIPSKYDDAMLANAAITCLAALESGTPEVATFLTNYATTRSEWNFHLKAARAFQALGTLPAELRDALRARLLSKDPVQVDMALEVVANLGPAGAPLISAVKSVAMLPDDRTHYLGAIRAIAPLQVSTLEIERVREDLNRSEYCLLALEALVAIDDARNVRAEDALRVLDQLPSDDWAAFVSTASGLTMDVRSELEAALETRLNEPPQESDFPLVGWSRPSRVAASIYCLGRLHVQSAETALVRCIETTPSEQVRSAAIMALGGLPALSTDSVKAILAAADTEALRRAATDTLLTHAPKSEIALNVARTLFASYPNRRIAVALAMVGDPEPCAYLANRLTSATSIAELREALADLASVDPAQVLHALRRQLFK